METKNNKGISGRKLLGICGLVTCVFSYSYFVAITSDWNPITQYSSAKKEIQISKIKRQKLHELLKLADINRGGDVDLGEFEILLKELGINVGKGLERPHLLVNNESNLTVFKRPDKFYYSYLFDEIKYSPIKQMDKAIKSYEMRKHPIKNQKRCE